MKRLLLIVCLFLAGMPAWAQSTASFRGIVEDDTAAAIPRARLILKRGDTEVARALGNEIGEFSFSGLAAGEYTLKTEADGFKAAETRVSVGASSMPMQRVQLRVASVNQEITVTAAAADPVAMDGNMNSMEVNHDLLKSLPVKDGNPVAAAALFLDPAANGAEGPKIVVDGVETSEIDVPSSSVKSVAVNKNPYSAEFGRPGRGRIEVVTRPGSLTRVHHHLVATFRNSALDATNAFASQQPGMNKVLLEGDMNGPLFHQKGSFYMGGEFLNDTQHSFIRAITPAGPVTDSVTSPERSGKLLVRVDYRLTPAQTFSVRYNFNRDTAGNQGISPFDLPERGYNTRGVGHELRSALTSLVSVNLSNELRFAFKDRDKTATPVSDAPATMVLGAFNSGGAQFNQHLQEQEFEVQDAGTWVHGKHTLRFGGTAKRRNFDITDTSNFGGTATFSNLAALAANQPFLVTINQGNPALNFSQTEYSYFVQDEMRFSQNLSLMAGVRHELQTNLSDHNNFGPRAGFAYAPGHKDLVFRAGAGVFYDRQPWSMEQQKLIYDSEHVRHIFLQNPVLPVTAAALNAVPPSTYTIDSAIRAPYVVQASGGVDKSFGKHNFLSVEYTYLRGFKLFRLRDINASQTAGGLRPNPAFVSIDQFESNGSSRTNSLAVTYRTAIAQKIEFMSQYTLARSTDDTSGMFFLPADNFNLGPERGRSDFDRRHRLNLAGIFTLPWGLKFGTITSMSSSIPYNITTGFDNNGDGVARDRPAGVTRNTGKGPMYSEVDFRLSKRIVIIHREKSSPYMEIRLDAFNVLNQVNAKNYIGVLTSPLFGVANAAYPARQLQISVKASF